MFHSQILKSNKPQLKKITKAGKDFTKKLDFKYIKILVKIRDIHNIEKKNFIGISVFDYQNKEKHPVYV